MISTEYKIDQILIKVPSGSDEKLSDDYKNKALEITKKIKDGLSFEDAINKYSDLKDADDFGGLYWKKKSEIPSLFEKK